MHHRMCDGIAGLHLPMPVHPAVVTTESVSRHHQKSTRGKVTQARATVPVCWPCEGQLPIVLSLRVQTLTLLKATRRTEELTVLLSPASGIWILTVRSRTSSPQRTRLFFTKGGAG